jgi:NADH-quinone oxidoreductase subunit L
MFLAMGVGAFGAGIFHLYTHAFFKACLFLGSGAVIHALHGEQDVRNMGGLRKQLPITFWTFLIASIAIAGVPGLAGFFSKDEILYETFKEGHTILWVIGIITSLLTATYMFRLVFLTFFGQRRHDAPAPEHPEEEEPAAHGAQAAHAASAAHDAQVRLKPDPTVSAHDHGHPASPHGGSGLASADHGHGDHLHDAPPAMALALIVLAIGSVVAGYIGLPHALGGHNSLGEWLAPAFHAVNAAGGEAARETAEGATGEGGSLELTLMLVSSVIALIGVGIGWFIWDKRRDIADSMARRFSGLHRLLMNKYYVDELYDTAIVHPIEVISEQGLWRGADVKLIDGTVNGAAAIVDMGASVLRLLQSGSVRIYASSVIVGVVVILGYYLWRL